MTSKAEVIGLARNYKRAGVVTTDCTNNQLDERRLRLGENLVHLRSNLFTSGPLQIPHRRFHVRMAQPLLNPAQIHSRPKTPSGERSTELVKPEVVFVELRTLCNGFQAVQKIQLRIAPSSRKHQTARPVSFRLPRLQTLNQLRGYGIAFFICLRRPSSISLVADPKGCVRVGFENTVQRTCNNMQGQR